MADTSQGTQGKRLDDVYGILGKLAESQAAITKTQASLAEGQAALARSVSELVSVQKETLEAQKEMLEAEKETAHSMKEMLDVQKKTNAANGTPPPTMDAGSRLTGIFELLEHILLDDCVTMDILLLAQRVNKTFNATINNSKALQQKLFFAPLPANAVQEVKLLKVNPLLANGSFLGRLPLYFEPSSRRLKFFDKNESGRLRLSAGVPAIQVTRSYWSGSGYMRELSPHLYWCFFNHSTSHTSPAPDSRLLMAGSWRRMYLSQPPRPVFFDVHTSTRYANSRGYKICERLCTINELLDVVAENALKKFY
ncbi:hypothetical protein LTR17_001264 [Elasticomyces elasticus]|nr:hypothetical protein LTR17_001264 [Elasticomyces elasticus]